MDYLHGYLTISSIFFLTTVFTARANRAEKDDVEIWFIVCLLLTFFWPVVILLAWMYFTFKFLVKL